MTPKRTVPYGSTRGHSWRHLRFGMTVVLLAAILMAPSCLLLDESLLRITSPSAGAVVSTTRGQVELSFQTDADRESLSVSLDGRCVTDSYWRRTRVRRTRRTSPTTGSFR